MNHQLEDYLYELEVGFAKVLATSAAKNFSKINGSDMFYGGITALVKTIQICSINMIKSLRDRKIADPVEAFATVENLMKISLGMIEKEIFGDVNAHHSEQPDARSKHRLR